MADYVVRGEPRNEFERYYHWAERLRVSWMSHMKCRFFIPAAIALMGVSGLSWADEPEAMNPDDDGEVTISLMLESEDELPEAVTKHISLPELGNLVGNEQAQDSVKKRAEQALQDAATKGNREHDRSHANEARQQAQNMADDAKARNEDRSRGQDNRPERPEPPGPPENPPGRN